MLFSYGALRKSLDWVTVHLPEIYLVVALTVCTALCVLTVPFGTPDESNHARRGAQLARGEVIAQMMATGSGGPVDVNLMAVTERMMAIQEAFARLHAGEKRLPDGRVTEAEMLSVQSLPWAHRLVPARFPNTAAYPPGLYLPQTVGWWIGEKAGLTVLHTLTLARLCAAWCAILLGWATLRVGAEGRWPLFAYLLLPTELSLMSSCSQDALQFSLAGLVTALLWRALAGRRELTAREAGVVTCVIALCVMARVTYLPVALMLLLPGLEVEGRGWRKFALPGAGIFAVVVAVGAWQTAVHSLGTLVSETARPALQVALLKAHPLHGLRSLMDALLVVEPMLFRRGLYLFGMNDATPPRIFHGLLLLGLAGMIGLSLRGGVRKWTSRGVVVVVLLGVGAGTWLAQYIIWTPPGAIRVEGLQVRYFLPLLPFLLLLCPAWLADVVRRGMEMRPRFWGAMKVASVGIFVVAVLYAPWAAAHSFYGSDLGRALVIAGR